MKIVEQRKENDTCNLTSCDSFYIRMVSAQSNWTNLGSIFDISELDTRKIE